WDENGRKPMRRRHKTIANPTGAMMRKTLSFIALILAFAPLATAQRLPEIATPESYQLTIALDFNKENFTGDETISVRVLRPTSTIVLSAAEITFADVTVTAAGTTQPAKAPPDEEKQMATLALDHPIAAGPATVHIRYTGILN